MSELIVIGFDNPVTARAAYDEVLALQSDFIVDLRGVAVVTVDAEGQDPCGNAAENRGHGSGARQSPALNS